MGRHTYLSTIPPRSGIVDAQPLPKLTRPTRTILDTFPVSPGHTLVIPKRHFADLLDATPGEMGDLWQALRQAAERITVERRSDGFNVGVNVGAAAGQTVMHLHVHLIPRYAV